MGDCHVEETGSLLDWSREGIRSLVEGFQAGHGLRLILGTAIGLLLLALALRGVSWPLVRSALAKANYPLLALALGTVLVTTLAKAARWRLLFPQECGRPRLSKLFSVLLIGQTVNAGLPARLGEIARAYFIGEIEGVDKALALSTVIVEKALDAFMLLLLLALLFLLMPLPAWLGRSGILISGLLAAVVGLVIVGVVRIQWIQNRTERIAQRFNLQRRLATITAALTTLCRRHVAVPLVSWSVLVWALAALTNCVTFLALGIDVPFLAALLLLAALHLGVAVPSSPGRVGVFHYICILSLSLFSVDRSVALSYGLVLHLVVFVPMMSLGTWFLWKENYELSKSKAEAKLAAGEATDP